MQEDVQKDRPMIVLIGGVPCSGKTSLGELISNKLEGKVTHIQLEWYNREVVDEYRDNSNSNDPDNINWELLESHLNVLLAGQPCYEKRCFPGPSPVIIVDGCCSLYCKKIFDMAQLRIFVDCDLDLALIRRTLLDSKAGLSMVDIYRRHIHHDKPAYENWILPTRNEADICIPTNIGNDMKISVGANLVCERLVKHVYTK